ncbi:hypothetical protein ACFOEK_04055 [Litoribrevibacter euphylliae]|uniref:DUF2497 domain-containing protein n=1 Tax=Litoribrevibacter euphylliae TaxID=1834034 RepID=A0ABV7HC10_9GAMM
MSTSGKGKKDLLGDLENIKDLLGDTSIDSTPSTSNQESSDNLDEIPLLSDVVPQDKSEKKSSSPSSATANRPTNSNLATNASEKQSTSEAAENNTIKSNPFIPYEAINRLKEERQTMKNFAAEVMKAAQQGISKNELDQFDLFKYSRSTKREIPPTSEVSKKEAPSQTDTKQPAPPSEMEIEVIINQVIEDYRPVLEEAMRDALLAFYKNESEKNSPQ